MSVEKELTLMRRMIWKSKKSQSKPARRPTLASRSSHNPNFMRQRPVRRTKVAHSQYKVTTIGKQPARGQSGCCTSACSASIQGTIGGDQSHHSLPLSPARVALRVCTSQIDVLAVLKGLVREKKSDENFRNHGSVYWCLFAPNTLFRDAIFVSVCCKARHNRVLRFPAFYM